MTENNNNKQEDQDFKYSLTLVQRDMWNNFQEVAKNPKFGLKQVYPLPDSLQKPTDRIVYSKEDDKGRDGKYNLAISLVKGRKTNNKYKESIEVLGREFLESSGLVTKILKEIQKLPEIKE